MPATSFRQALQSERLAISADLTLTNTSGAEDIRRQADALRGLVDAVQVTDNPFAWVQMSALAACSLVRQYGLDAVPVLNCRDRNRIALTSDLLGLRALGVESLLLTRGHRLPPEHPISAKAVFDTQGRELVAMAARLGESDPSPPGENFHIGVGARVIRPRENWSAAWLNERADAGAQFLQTQLCLNLGMLKEYLAALVDARLTWKYSVIVTLAILPSAQTARWLKQNMSDVRIPKAIITRLEASPDEAREGLAIAAEMLEQVACLPAVSGIHLMTLGDAEALPRTLRAAGLRP